MWKPFDSGPDRHMEVPAPLDADEGARVQIGEAMVLAIGRDGYGSGRVLVAFDKPAYAQPCWLSQAWAHWRMADTNKDYGIATISMPRWVYDHIYLFEARALVMRRRHEAANEAEKKYEERQRLKRASAAMKAARAKNLF